MPEALEPAAGFIHSNELSRAQRYDTHKKLYLPLVIGASLSLGACSAICRGAPCLIPRASASDAPMRREISRMPKLADALCAWCMLQVASYGTGAVVTVLTLCNNAALAYII